MHSSSTKNLDRSDKLSRIKCLREYIVTRDRMRHVGNTDVDHTKMVLGNRAFSKALEMYSYALYHSLPIIRKDICEDICVS